MNSRLGLMGALAAKLPARYKVIAPKALDAIEPKHPVVMVIRTNMEPGPNLGSYISTFAVWIIEPKLIDPEDDLDDALDEVIVALDGYDFVTWTDAERSTYLDQPAYRLTAKTIDKKEPRP